MFYISADELDKEKFNVDLYDPVNNGFGYSINGYVSGASAPVHVHDVFNGTLFFLEKDVNPGSKFQLRFTKMASSSPLISRLQANTIPFSSNKLLEILTRIQVKPTSATASVMNKTLIECEGPTLDGESKHCATSLESMVEFIMLSLGTRDVQASSTTITEKSGNFEAKKTYNFASVGVHALGRDELVAACHLQPYPYAVFYCHTTEKTKAYTIALEGNDGTKVEAIAVCHCDTSKWNPKHLSFQVLKVKPGSVPVCHFMPEDDVLWTIRN